MPPKQLSCVDTFFCVVCGRMRRSMLVRDTETGETWRECISCDTKEPGKQSVEVKDEQK